MEIGEEIKAAFEHLRKQHDQAHGEQCQIAACKIAKFARDVLAEAMELKFRLSHRVMPSKIISMQQESFGEQEGCELCGPREKFDPRHNWTPEDYKRAAHAALMGEQAKEGQE